MIFRVMFIISMIPIKLILVLLGTFFIAVAALSKAYVKVSDNLSKPNDGPIYAFTWKIMRPWGNHTDGIANRNYKQFDSMFWQIMYWSAWRNPANGLRTMPVLSVLIDQEKIHAKGSDRNIHKYKDRTPHWFVCWHGIYSCLFIQFYIYPGHMRRLWIGWKLLPQDCYGVKDDDYRKQGAAFTTQFKRIQIL